jgi:hypothetical protein
MECNFEKDWEFYFKMTEIAKGLERFFINNKQNLIYFLKTFF